MLKGEELKEGDKIRENRAGSAILTVLKVRGTTVWVYEHSSCLHITKVVRT